MEEPKIHSHITDSLEACHPLAFKNVFCSNNNCKEMVHAFNNECMQTWVETGKGNFCILCFNFYSKKVLDDSYGIPDPTPVRKHVICDVCGEWYEVEPEQCVVCGEENNFTNKGDDNEST